MRKDTLVAAFKTAVDLLAGGAGDLQHDRGKWIDLVRGKDILPSVIDQCRQVRALDGKILQGSDARQTVGKELLSLPLGGHLATSGNCIHSLRTACPQRRPQALPITFRRCRKLPGDLAALWIAK